MLADHPSRLRSAQTRRYPYRGCAPASPWQNGYAEWFHSKLRDEFLDREEFEGEGQARASGALWKGEYDTERPRSSLGYQTPAEYAAACVRYVPIDENPTEPELDEHPHP